MHSKEIPWIIACYILLFLPTTCTCFLHSSLPTTAGEKFRQTFTVLLDAGSTNSFSFADVANQGITSLLKEEKSGTILAGTKSGEVLQSMDNAMTWTQLSGYNHKPKYPVYSLAVETKASNDNDKNSKLGRIFCGRGDRYISVWDTEIKEYVQRLGPHTGWVQDLAYNEDAQILYSIGCNCIEVWDCSGRDTSDGSIRHISKLSVENSVLASTLSSDLLRLCLVDGQHVSSDKERGKGTKAEKKIIMFSGVDGRIHLRSSYRQTSLVHKGRINALTYSSMKSQILFSVGNDGKLCASRINFYSSMEIELLAELELKGLPRLTTVTILEEADNGELYLVVGTTEGDIIFVSAKVKSSDNSITLMEGGTTNVHNGAKIYSAIALPKGSPFEPNIEMGSSHTGTRVLLVGHAKGLTKQPYCLPFKFQSELC
ncbi:unnamed protein product [Cylindrotheca closterium]|uniref:Uncharacterized protein n=1 Tax=Cylindrotheca closterium TaxID=2856 RepID=A0AAD2GA96_9STRA|nr:unnamed protein product [Cylindrotheca closterium]